MEKSRGLWRLPHITSPKARVNLVVTLVLATTFNTVRAITIELCTLYFVVVKARGTDSITLGQVD